MSPNQVIDKPAVIGRHGCEYGRTLMPILIDSIAQQDPDRPYAELVIEDGSWRTVSIAQLARAIDKAAYWMDEHIEAASCEGYVAYAGPQDLRYLLLIIAGVKTNRTV